MIISYVITKAMEVDANRSCGHQEGLCADVDTSSGLKPEVCEDLRTDDPEYPFVWDVLHDKPGYKYTQTLEYCYQCHLRCLLNLLKEGKHDQDS